MQKAMSRGVSFHNVSDDELAVLEKVIRLSFNSIESFFYDFDSKEIVVQMKQDSDSSSVPTPLLPLRLMSDSERSLFLLYADIVRRSCLLNPHLGMNVSQETDGIILIDDIDSHLDEDLQKKVIQGLRRSFPKIQFIASAHSAEACDAVPVKNILNLDEAAARS